MLPQVSTFSIPDSGRYVKRYYIKDLSTRDVPTNADTLAFQAHARESFSSTSDAFTITCEWDTTTGILGLIFPDEERTPGEYVLAILARDGSDAGGAIRLGLINVERSIAWAA